MARVVRVAGRVVRPGAFGWDGADKGYDRLRNLGAAARGCDRRGPTWATHTLAVVDAQAAIAASAQSGRGVDR